MPFSGKFVGETWNKQDVLAPELCKNALCDIKKS